jgi:hypothetical protein
MAIIHELLHRLVVPKEVRISSQGIALWICWDGDLDSSVNHTLQDYGGISILSDRSQSLWFFFSDEVLLSLARLSVWSQFHPLPVGVQVFSARLIVGSKRELSLSVDPNLQHQEFLPPQNLQIFVHPKVRESAQLLPGINYSEPTMISGMALVKWSQLLADLRMPYNSTSGWFSLLRPIGNPLDKKFQAGWRHMFAEIDTILQSHKLKFMISENFVIVSLDNLHALRVWTRELTSSINKVKELHPEDYWPCVCAIIDKKGMNFNNELPNKASIKWSQLAPDYPYMSYRTA